MSPAELVILFLHCADDAVTQAHLAIIQKLNPGVPVVPLAFKTGLPEAKLFTTIDRQYKNSDRLLYEWFQSPDMIMADRYVILEWDTFCTVPVKDFYKPCWDKPAAAAQIHSIAKDPCWLWFHNSKWQARYGKNLCGLSPTCGVMFSHAALNDVATLAHDPAHQDLYSEVRLGTMLAMTGHQPAVIFPGVSKYIACVWRKPRGDGIWHSVKTFPHE